MLLLWARSGNRPSTSWFRTDVRCLRMTQKMQTKWQTSRQPRHDPAKKSSTLLNSNISKSLDSISKVCVNSELPGTRRLCHKLKQRGRESGAWDAFQVEIRLVWLFCQSVFGTLSHSHFNDKCSWPWSVVTDRLIIRPGITLTHAHPKINPYTYFSCSVSPSRINRKWK